MSRLDRQGERDKLDLRATTPRSAMALRAGWKLLVVGPVLSGIGLWASFWLPWLTWFALVPLGLLIRTEGSRRLLYFGAWLGGLAFYLPGVQWVRYADPSAWAGWLLLALYLSFYWPAFVLVARVWNRRWRMPVLFAMPIVWVATEYAHTIGDASFGWLLVAHSLYRWTWTIQSADFGGVYAVSFLAVAVNAFFVELLTSPILRVKEGRLRLVPAFAWRLGVTATMVIGALAYGRYRVGQADWKPGPRLALIQTDLPQSLKDNDPKGGLDHVLSLTADAARELRASGRVVDLVIWPETSYPYSTGEIAEGIGDLELDRLRLLRMAQSGPNTEAPSAETGGIIRENITLGVQTLEKVTSDLRVPLLVGAAYTVYRPGLPAARYNASILFDPREGKVGSYLKIHLVPFGEYLPFERWIPGLERLMPYEAGAGFGLDAATDYRTLHDGKLHFATLICFEDTIPHLAREFIRRATPEKPVDFFVNQSNDGWFRGSIEPDYHLAASVFRAIECRTPLVRVANTGITALIDGAGSLDAVLHRENEDGSTQTKSFAGFVDVTVPLDARRAPYVTLGDWLPTTCLAIAVLGMLLSTLRHARRIRAMLGRTTRTRSTP